MHTLKRMVANWPHPPYCHSKTRHFLSKVTELVSARATNLNSKIFGSLPGALSTTSVYSTEYSLKTFAKGDMFSNLVLIIFLTEPLIQTSVNMVTV